MPASQSRRAPKAAVATGDPLWSASLVLLLLLLLTTPSLALAQSADDILSRFDDEPTVVQVQQEALNYAGLDPELIQDWYGLASASAILPDRLQYKFQFRDDTQITERFTGDLNSIGENLGEERQDTERTIDRITHEVQVRWDLTQLIFNTDMRYASQEAVRQSKQREDVLTEITKLFYDRRRLQIELILDPPTEITEQLKKELKLQEITAEIDAYTGSWFSDELARVGKAPY